METEVWKSVVGYEGKYEVSNLGSVRSLPRPIERFVNGNLCVYFKKGRILKLNSSGSNYLRVELCLTGIRKKHYVHRLVAEAFIPNPTNLPCVNHKYGDKTDNKSTNLQWCSYSENNQHAIDTGLSLRVGETCHLSKLSEQQVLDICSKLDGGSLTPTQIALEYGVTPENIRYIDKGLTWNRTTGRRIKSI